MEYNNKLINRFSRDLLMPSEYTQRELEKIAYKSHIIMAEIFYVPHFVMSKRFWEWGCFSLINKINYFMELYKDYPRLQGNKDVFEKYMSKIPIDVEGICRELGIEIVNIDMSEIEKNENGREISGILLLEKNKKIIKIYTNKKDNYGRRRFTIAHELGHYILHCANIYDDLLISYRRDTTEKEREANRFSAELLMPEEYVKEQHSKLKYKSHLILSILFRVSDPAMDIRLNELGLQNYDEYWI